MKRANTSWSILIWFLQGVPRFSFSTWLAVKNRLFCGAEQSCLFCGERNETRDHLFLACPYTFTVWLDLAGTLLGSAANPD